MSRNRLSLRIGKLIEGNAEGPMGIFALVTLTGAILLARTLGLI